VSRTKLASAGIASAAVVVSMVTMMSGTANATPVQSGAISLTCVQEDGGVIWSPDAAGLLRTYNPGVAGQLKFVVTTPIHSPIAIGPGAVVATVRTVQTTANGSGVGTAWDFGGANTVPHNAGNPLTVGPLTTAAPTTPAGTRIRMVDSSAAAPSASNWSVKVVAFGSLTIYCAGKQGATTDDYTF
jgi:hypothetical protein